MGMRDAARVMPAGTAAAGEPPAGVLRLASDQRLVEHVRAGSVRAFEILFDRHHRSVVRFCARMLGSHEEAEDVTQQTFLVAYRDLVRSTEPVALGPWLFGIARHRCLAALGGRRERPVGEVPEAAGTYDLTVEVGVRDDVRAMLSDAARLPDQQRIALVLAELGDLPHGEIARVLGCRREKVKALVFQARSSLGAARAARETSCDEIREQLATLRGPALRRTTLRRHLDGCPGCRAYRDAVRNGRRGLRAWIPWVAGIALRRPGVGAVSGSGGGAGGAALAGGALGGSGLFATAIVAAAIPVGGGVAAVMAARHDPPARAVPVPFVALHAQEQASPGQMPRREVPGVALGRGDQPGVIGRNERETDAGEQPAPREAAPENHRQAGAEPATGDGDGPRTDDAPVAAGSPRPARSASSPAPGSGEARKPAPQDVPPESGRPSAPGRPPHAGRSGSPDLPARANDHPGPATRFRPVSDRPLPAGPSRPAADRPQPAEPSRPANDRPQQADPSRPESRPEPAAPSSDPNARPDPAPGSAAPAPAAERPSGPTGAQGGSPGPPDG
jgi:RNA polymerase sigma factor (sigma-70 family)